MRQCACIAAVLFFTISFAARHSLGGNHAARERIHSGQGTPSLRLPTEWPMDSPAGHWFFTVGIGAGTGYVTGKVYDDNLKTPDISGDGPTIIDKTTNTGPIIRWAVGYVLRRGLGFALFARLQITRGSTTKYDNRYDAWIIGLRVLRLVHVKGQLGILPFLALGYGRMRHIIRDTILPKGPAGDFYRPSGNFNVGAGVAFVYRFTPVFNFFVDLIGDVMFPSLSLNLDAVAGLGLSY